MNKNENIQYGIKYRVIPLEEEKYILFPVSIEKGIETGDGFRTDKRLIPLSYDIADLENGYVIDMVFYRDELENIYEYDGDDESFLLDYFYDDFKNTIIYLDASSYDYISRNEINLDVINSSNQDLTFVMDKALPAIILNEKALDEILRSDNVDEVKLIITKYRRLLQSFKEFNEQKGITKINVSNGEIDSIEVRKKYVPDSIEEKIVEKEDDSWDSSIVSSENTRRESVSYRGLRDYILERVFGHDEEIATFAQKLYMNYTAEEGDCIDSILLVGPTGVGKTETVKAACNYLDIPSFSVNASNIVPQGIKGMCIEDVIVGLFEEANYDEEKAARGLVFLDEFDKLNESDLDLKSAVKSILLTFTAGGCFPIDNDRYTFTFDSSMVNKVYAGVFERINGQKRGIGFNDVLSNNSLGNEDEIRRKIIEKGYFSLEELSRISSLIAFNELDRETKKKILLQSKLSEFAKKRSRYQRQFGVDLIADDSYIEAVLDSISNSATGMRSVNNFVLKTINEAEKALLEEENGKHKQLILTNKTVEDYKDFDLS